MIKSLWMSSMKHNGIFPIIFSFLLTWISPSCQAFITTTLANTLALADISAITDLKMVPYGNTKKNADGSFTCQHGQGECESDVLEMCTMYKLSGDINSIIDGSTSEQAWPFIQCMELAEGDPTKGESCFSSTLASSGLTWQTVVECSEQEELDVQNAGMKATPKVVNILLFF
jgi:interferon, gamma-inducible protein 30